MESLLGVVGDSQKSLDGFIDTYNTNQKKMNSFVDTYLNIKSDLERSIKTFNNNYQSCKSYFFNGDEDSFRMMDTDEFFKMCFFNNIKLVSHSPSENRIYLKTEEGIMLATNNRFYTLKEIFTRGGYSIPQLHQFKEFVVFDIGMNRGYAALKFASYDNCRAVYGFEIDSDTFDFAIENFELNEDLYKKIKPHKFGLSNKNEELDIYCLPGADGVTTTELEFTKLQSEWINGKARMKTKKAEVKNAGEILSNIIEKENIESNIVLKIDTEGSEAKIIDSLIDKDVLDKVDVIMGEIHFGLDDLDEKLKGFKNISKVYFTDTIYSFCYVKEELFNVLPIKEF